MHILVIDGQGGRIGRSLIELIKQKIPEAYVTAVGTNAMATAAMLKGGADDAATGENPVVFMAARADVIVGPIGIVTADSLLGEVTAKMAEAVGRSDAVRILIPVDKCNTKVAGIGSYSSGKLIEDAVRLIQEETLLRS